MNKPKIALASVTLMLLCLMLLSEPALMLFNEQSASTTHVPHLFIYLLAVWIIAIVGSYLVFNRKSDSKSK